MMRLTPPGWTCGDLEPRYLSDPPQWIHDISALEGSEEYYGFLSFLLQQYQHPVMTIDSSQTIGDSGGNFMADIPRLSMP